MSESWLLPQAFELTQPPGLAAIVGGGGKTSLLFGLARALPGRVVVTTTTRIFAAQMALATAVLQYEPESNDDARFFADLSAKLDQQRLCLVVGPVSGEKAFGVPSDLPGRLLARPDVDFVLVEADGSRMRPIKAPAAHEPVIPPEATLVIPVVGIDALDQPLDVVSHRPERIAQILGLEPGHEAHLLSVAEIAALLVHPQGGLKDVPAGARVMPLVNKVETAVQFEAATQIARQVLQEPRIKQVVIGAVKREQPVKAVARRVTAVVLAAGESRRMGRTKQLLPWGDTTMLGQVLRNLKATAVHDILVVSGHDAEKIESTAAAEGVHAIRNARYVSGEMLSSLQTAVAQLPAHIDAVLVMLADQPQITPQIIDALLYAYWRGQNTIVAPIYAGKRGNPVLIDRAHFAELLTLPPDAAPRDLLKQNPVQLVPAATDAVLRDLDEWEIYMAERPQ